MYIFLIIPFFFALLYIYNKNLFFIFCLYFLTAGRLFFFKLGNVYAPTVYNTLFATLLFLFFIELPLKKRISSIFFFLIIYVTYFLFLSLLHENNPVININTYKTSFLGLLYGILLVNSIINKKIRICILLKALYILIFVQCCLAWGQFLNKEFCDLFRVEEYNWQGVVSSMTGISDDMVSNNLMLGTMMRPSIFASFLSITFLILLLYEFLNSRKLSMKKKLFFIFLFFTLLFTGIRSPFGICITGLFFLVYKYRKKDFKYFLCLFFVFIAFLVVLGIANSFTDGSFVGENSLANPLSRMTRILIIFDSNSSLVEAGTLGLSIQMLPYVVQNVFFGIGLHESSGYYLANSGKTLELLSTTDAQLCFMIAEIGLAGVLLYLFPFLFYSKILKNYFFIKKGPCFILFMGLIMTIVDVGVCEIVFVFLFFYGTVLFVPNVTNKL